MRELLSMDFFQNGLIMGLLLSCLFGILSFFVVSRKMVFLGAGIAHTAFGGVALGVVLSVNPLYTALIFCISSALIIGMLVKDRHLEYDSGIGIFFAFSMALGAILIAIRKAYTFDLTGYLFGNILGVTHSDIILTLSITLLFIVYMSLFMRRIIFVSFDKPVASVSGIPSDAIEMSLLVFLAVIIVISIKMIGIVLVSALIVLPASFGKLLFRNFRHVILSGILYMMVITLGGTFAAYYFDLPAGATIVVFGTLLYFVSVVPKVNRR